MLTGRQMRAARALLRWSAQDLAARSKVGISTIRRTELVDGSVRMIPGNVEAVVRAFLAAGVEMIPENGGGLGVRLSKPGDHA